VYVLIEDRLGCCGIPVSLSYSTFWYYPRTCHYVTLICFVVSLFMTMLTIFELYSTSLMLCGMFDDEVFNFGDGERVRRLNA
jgi:hypothetical protein